MRILFKNFNMALKEGTEEKFLAAFDNFCNNWTSDKKSIYYTYDYED